MNATLIRRLIVKDWYLSRVVLLLVALAGTGSIGLMFMRREVTGLLSITSALIVLIMLSILLPMTTIVNERKRQNLPFIMSLPISPADYTTAKVIANLTAFVVLWLAIAAGVLGTIASAGTFGGLIPLGIVVALAPFVYFCLMLGVALVTESELASIVTMGACNISYSFAWFFLVRIPGIRQQLQSPVPIWSDMVLWLIAIEVTLIVVILCTTFVLQSRKTDFI